VQDGANTKIISALYSGLQVVWVNTNVPALSNKLVRQGLSLAIDREALVKHLVNGQGIAANGSIVKGDLGYNPERPPIPDDPQKARDLLRMGGYNGAEIIFTVRQSDVPAAEALVGMLQAVGVNATIEVVEISVMAAMTREKSYKGLWLSSPTSTLGDPAGGFWRSMGPDGPNRYLADAEFERLGQLADLT